MNPKENISIIKITLPSAKVFKTPFINVYGAVNRADFPSYDESMPHFLLEDGGALLWEDGGKILLEKA